VKSIESEGDELLGIVLLVSGEGGSESSDGSFELGRREGGGGAEEELGDEDSEGVGDLTLHSERVLTVDLLLEDSSCSRRKNEGVSEGRKKKKEVDATETHRGSTG